MFGFRGAVSAASSRDEKLASSRRDSDGSIVVVGTRTRDRGLEAGGGGGRRGEEGEEEEEEDEQQQQQAVVVFKGSPQQPAKVRSLPRLGPMGLTR